MSVSTGLANAAFSSKGILTLNSLASSAFDASSPYSSTAGVRTLTSGVVQELIFAGWSSQNPGVEWINAFIGSDSASNYEVRLAVSSSSGLATYSGPTLGSYHTISTTRQFQWTKTNVGTFSWSGTMTIREIAATSNSVSATVIISIENGL